MGSASADARVGTEFGQRFKISRKIGSGGTSTVYLARDNTNDQQIALKILEREGDNDTALKRFLRECQIMNRLQHPHIVLVHEAGETNRGELWLAMEVLKGRTLAKQLRQHGPMEPERIVTIGQQIAAALTAAHAQQILHRDLKPANVRLISKGGNRDYVKVLDFAIARFVENDESENDEQLTAVGKVVGTPHYMAPEQIASRQLDGRCDLYALGCMLYEMATGRTPFTGKTFEVMRQHAFDKPPAVNAVSDQRVPDDLATLIMQLLEKDPNDRPTDARQVEHMLIQVRHNLSTDSPSKGLSFDDLTDQGPGTAIPGGDLIPASADELSSPPKMGSAKIALAGFGTVFFVGAAVMLVIAFIAAIFLL